MRLNIGDHQNIENPTPQDIALDLGNLPAGAPFMILDADVEHFVQVILLKHVFRVEWRQEADRRFILVTLEEAEQAFSRFAIGMKPRSPHFRGSR